ncbi:MAG: hypothetical protein DRQ02_01745 [Candidatus Latescibacterota bacterium]|nr:MAG: hypothetical protein DRQ02_01745 [Candidatus Latescibacterota bacterium]RKY73803.1 MAG: hypothetical protein DRQ24_01590 [Candidatus Latescibacterota bacterium]
MQASDEELVANLKKGDRKAFESLVNHCQKMVFNLAYRTLGKKEDAEDGAQESFIRLYRSIARFRERAKFSTWLYRIVSSVCLSKLRPTCARRALWSLMQKLR